MSISFFLILLFAALTGAGIGLLCTKPLHLRLVALHRQRIHQRLNRIVGFSLNSRADEVNERQPWWISAGLFLAAPSAKEYQAVRERLFLAGLRRGEVVGSYYSVKFGLVLLAMLTTTTLWRYHVIPAAAIIISSVPFLLLPDLLLRLLTAHRLDKMTTALPDFIDLCNICMTAGLSWLISVKRVSEELQAVHPVICAEFSYMFDQIQTGMNRQQALRQLAQRNPTKEMQYLVNILLQSERTGSTVLNALNHFPKRIYTLREQTMEEKVGKLSAKMAIIIMPFMLMPYMLLLVGEQITKLLRVLSP